MAKVPIDENIMTTPLEPVEQVRLKGFRCRNCGEAFFGKFFSCENCGSEDMEEIVFSTRGKLYSYTIVEHRPPDPYKGPSDPFIPFAEGLVELPEGCRIVAPLTVNKDEDVKIGMDVELVIEKYCEDEEGNEVMTFKFKPV